MIINQQDAIKAKDHALKAIVELNKLLLLVEGKCSEEEYEQIKKAVGLSIGRIDVDILSLIYAAYPELDDLKNK